MSNLPLAGLKILDLSAPREGSPCAQVLGLWGAERLMPPPSLRLDHPEGRRILLMLVQEVDVLVTREDVDLALLQEYNPMLIICRSAEADLPWAAISGILAALLHRERFGLGQQVTLDAGEGPRFSGFASSSEQAADPLETLARLGYAPEAIATLRREGVF
ncbi:formyl-coenzyme A transferase [compost metagenome]